MAGIIYLIGHKDEGSRSAERREPWNDFPVSTPPPVRVIDGERSVPLDEHRFPAVIKKLENYGILDSRRGVTIDPVTGESKVIPEKPKEIPQPVAQPQQS